jgi:3-oxoacyl-[acyl-carrier-protein] synthase II
MTAICVTGIGVVTAPGEGPDPLEADLLKEDDEPIRLGSLTGDGLYPYAPLPPEFDGRRNVTPCTVLDRCMEQIASGGGAVVDAVRGSRTALVLGATEGVHCRWLPGDPHDHLDDAMGVDDFREQDVAERFASVWRLRGPHLTVSSACASTATALGVAVDLIRSGTCDRALAGGAAVMNWFDVHGFLSAKLLARRRARPFDRGRDGLMLGEGGALVLLERRGEAVAEPFAEIAECASNNERHAIAAPEPSGGRLAECVREALEACRIAPEEVGYINAHGTGTVANDASEAAALSTLFGRNRTGTLVSSTKGLHGHLRGASGVVELVVTMLALAHGFAPANRGGTDPIDECRWRCVSPGPEFRDLGCAVTVSRGFGGVNVAIVVRTPR